MNHDLLQSILKFRDDRDWKQFHTPKNLAMSIAIEAAELMEVFQWPANVSADAVAPSDLERARDEIADVGIYLALLSHDLGINMEQAMADKLEKNARKYPVERFKGVFKAKIGD